MYKQWVIARNIGSPIAIGMTSIARLVMYVHVQYHVSNIIIGCTYHRGTSIIRTLIVYVVI